MNEQPISSSDKSKDLNKEGVLVEYGGRTDKTPSCSSLPGLLEEHIYQKLGERVELEEPQGSPVSIMYPTWWITAVSSYAYHLWAPMLPVLRAT